LMADGACSGKMKQCRAVRDSNLIEANTPKPDPHKGDRVLC
jgi:hypothetical protein